MSITYEDIVAFSTLAVSQEDAHKDYLRCINEELLPDQLTNGLVANMLAIGSKIHGYTQDEALATIREVNKNLDADLLEEFIKMFKRMYAMVKRKSDK